VFLTHREDIESHANLETGDTIYNALRGTPRVRALCDRPGAPRPLPERGAVRLEQEHFFANTGTTSATTASCRMRRLHRPDRGTAADACARATSR